jgi:hypothetical protein
MRDNKLIELMYVKMFHRSATLLRNQCASGHLFILSPMSRYHPFNSEVNSFSKEVLEGSLLSKKQHHSLQTDEQDRKI